MELSLLSIDTHRNGVSGTPFAVMLFTMKSEDYDNGEPHRMMGVLFLDEVGSCAVFEFDMAMSGDIRFFWNSWRGDRFEDWMREQYKAYLEMDFETQKALGAPIDIGIFRETGLEKAREIARIREENSRLRSLVLSVHKYILPVVDEDDHYSISRIIHKINDTVDELTREEEE